MNHDEELSYVNLRFHVEHPDFEACYAEGYESAVSGRTERENPFALGTKESDQWLDGWWAGFYGEPPIYELSDYLTSGSDEAANDEAYPVKGQEGFFTKVLEITGVIAVSAIVGYQIIDLVA